jgi:hypothetical protein
MGTDRIEALARLLAAAKGTSALSVVAKFVEGELR